MNDLCGAEHPERPGVTCEKPLPCWEIHISGRHDLFWPGKPMPPRHSDPRRIVEITRRSAQSRNKTGPPVVRTIDPPTAHLAAERIEPKRGTAKANILDHLRHEAGGWVDAYELAVPDIGGSEATRRIRELRQEGWPIEAQPKPGSQTAWQYRLPLLSSSTPPPPRSENPASVGRHRGAAGVRDGAPHARRQAQPGRRHSEPDRADAEDPPDPTARAVGEARLPRH